MKEKLNLDVKGPKVWVNCTLYTVLSIRGSSMYFYKFGISFQVAAVSNI